MADSRTAPEISTFNYSTQCYSCLRSEHGDLLRLVMRETGTTQSQLSRLSGVHQPSISQFLSGRVELSDDMLDRLLACMGRRLQVVRRVTEPDLTRSERRSWLLHRRISTHLTRDTWDTFEPVMQANLLRLRHGVTGQPHEHNLERWKMLVDTGDIAGIRRALTGLDRDSIQMREVSPMRGLLPQQERSAILAQTG